LRNQESMFMKIVKKRKVVLAFLCLITLSIQSRQLQNSDEIDVMVDFAYPVSIMQSIRQDLNQALYACQQKKYESALSMLHNAVSKLHEQEIVMNADDIAYMKAMINQINVLMQNVENDQDRSALIDLCQQVVSYL
jgi:hypothetical protein